MTASPIQFPLSGVIGIVDTSATLLQQAVERELCCVEVRADLLQTAGLSDEALMQLVQDTKSAGLACLFTLRHSDQGGTFNGPEPERVALCRLALESGADILDLEHGTQAADTLLAEGAPLILSYHNFERMLSPDELAKLSDAMEAQSPAAVKIIPTGNSLSDAAMMLKWVGAAGVVSKRIGFSMGSDGACSRILTIAHGAPITYASFGAPVAPGQVDMDALLNQYNIMHMTPQSELVALLGDEAQVESFFANYFANYSANYSDSATVHLAFLPKHKTELEKLQQTLKFKDIITLT